MRKFILLLVDIGLLYASLALTIWIRYGKLEPDLWHRHLVPFSFIFLLWIIVFFINGLYEIRKVRNDFKFYGKLIQNQIVNALLAVLFFYTVLGQVTTLRPQKVLLILLIIYTILFILWRSIFYRLISSA